MATSQCLIAVLCFNRPDLMQAVSQQVGYPLCVIDNGSAHPLSHDGHFMHLRFEQNRFFTGGWNRAMKLFQELEYDWVWMLNSDLTGLKPAMLEVLEKVAQQLPAALAISPTYNSPHGHMWKQGQDVRPVRWLDMAAPFMHVDRFLELGGFDEEFVGYGADMDLCKRSNGYTFHVVDTLGVVHGGGETAVSEGISQHTNLELMNQLLHDKWGVNSWTEMF